jgi:hypothetical protein
MKYVFIAVGGSGTKVAESLVNLLAVGFPTRVSGHEETEARQNGEIEYTSQGDMLEIWRLDPDASSGAADALQNCIDAYQKLQASLGGRWAMQIDPVIRHLDPLRLPQATEADNKVKTLEGILCSGYGAKTSSDPFMRLFYEPKDLEVKIDRGFYQKPFIGAAVMAIFAESLKDENSHGGSQCRLNHHESLDVRFFLCGSLHGGTGACGVPIMGKYLKARKKEKDLGKWRIGACLLAPYTLPPQPPFGLLKEGEQLTNTLLMERLRAYANEKAFVGLAIEEQKELAKQILLGFYASPEDMVARTRQGLLYYQDHASDSFDELYLVGKPEPDQLTGWSNGGKSQNNPLNSTETVAALAALNFFANADATRKGYMIGTSTQTLDSHRMRLSDLPHYTVGGLRVDPERVFLATAILHHTLLQQIPWDVPVRQWNKSIEGLKNFYRNDEDRKQGDAAHYREAAGLLANFIAATVFPDRALGWGDEDALMLGKFLSNDERVYREISQKMEKKGLFNERAKEPLTLKHASIEVSAMEFGRWRPRGDQFTRGEYLRHVWSKLFTKEND